VRDDPPALEADQIVLFRSLVCSGARWKLAACGTNQGIAPLLRAGGLDCAFPSTSLREAITGVTQFEGHTILRGVVRGPEMIKVYRNGCVDLQ
jgi:hypothetical protein